MITAVIVLVTNTEKRLYPAFISLCIVRFRKSFPANQAVTSEMINIKDVSQIEKENTVAVSRFSGSLRSQRKNPAAARTPLVYNIVIRGKQIKLVKDMA